jgi:archaellum component FlaC
MEPNPKGWGQILQTIGRGVRRSTHEGLKDEAMRTVRTAIYTTTLNEDKVKETREQQKDEVNRMLKLQCTEYKNRYHKLKTLLEERTLAADPSVNWTRRKDANESHLKKNLRTIAQNIQKLSLERDKLDAGWLKVFTGKESKKNAPKYAMVRTWALLPDEAIFNEIWTEENQRSKSDKIIKETAVDALLLKSFNNMTRSVSYASMQKKYTTDLREKVEKVKDQDQVLEMLVSEVGSEIDKFQGPQSSNTKEECSVCGDKGKLGVLCSERHFVCSACFLACYLSVSTQKPMRMSAKDAQQNFSGLLPSGSVECTKDSCFAFFCRQSSEKFPVYWTFMKEKTWKTRSTQHYMLFNNPFMKKKIQYLIQNSVRRECHTACDGKDGNGGGTASAIQRCCVSKDKGAAYRKWTAVAQVL